MLDEYRRRRDTLTAWLAEDTRLASRNRQARSICSSIGDILSPDGFRTSADLAQGLLDKARVALTPGEAFDAPGYIRLSYAASIERLRRAPRAFSISFGAHAGAVV